jgi:Family of unknown function (DUF6137)
VLAEMAAVTGQSSLLIGARDAIELIVRIEALFDCILGAMRYEPLSVEIDELAGRVLDALGYRHAELV